LLSAVVLAAGEAERMGRLKQILPWGEHTILETVIYNLLACDNIDDEIRVVIGAQAEKINKVLQKIDDPRLQLIENKKYKKGMLTSVWAGLRNLPRSTKYILFTLGDKPLITDKIYKEIIKVLKQKKPEILLPYYKEQRGHPVIIDSELLEEVYKLDTCGGLRGLIRKYPQKVYSYPLASDRILIDIDYYWEYEKYRSEFVK